MHSHRPWNPNAEVEGVTDFDDDFFTSFSQIISWLDVKTCQNETKINNIH